ERQATDAVVGEAISHHDGHVSRRIQLSRPQGGAGTRITSPKNQESVHATVLSVSWCKGDRVTTHERLSSFVRAGSRAGECEWLIARKSAQRRATARLPSPGQWPDRENSSESAPGHRGRLGKFPAPGHRPSRSRQSAAPGRSRSAWEQRGSYQSRSLPYIAWQGGESVRRAYCPR